MYGLSQWETTLQCNIVSYWLNPYPEWYHRYWCMDTLGTYIVRKLTVFGISDETVAYIFVLTLVYVQREAMFARLHTITNFILAGRALGCKYNLITCTNSLVPGRSGCDFKIAIFNLFLLIGIFRYSYENVFGWMPRDLIDEKSRLVQIMTLCCQSASQPEPMLTQVCVAIWHHDLTL